MPEWINTPSALSFFFGAVLVVSGMLGGGVKLAAIDIPRLTGSVRIVAIAIGAGLLLVGRLLMPQPSEADVIAKEFDGDTELVTTDKWIVQQTRTGDTASTLCRVLSPISGTPPRFLQLLHTNDDSYIVRIATQGLTLPLGIGKIAVKLGNNEWVSLQASFSGSDAYAFLRSEQLETATLMTELSAARNMQVSLALPNSQQWQPQWDLGSFDGAAISRAFSTCIGRQKRASR
jgi:hypothetical protein